MNYKIITSIVAALISVGTIGAISSNANTDNNTNSNSIQTVQSAEPEQKEQKEPRITTEEVAETSEEPFETEYYDDGNLASGTTRVDQEGQNGVRTKTYKVTYTDGKETSRELISDEITTEPVNKIVANGTYTAPAPATSEAQETPAGATAICNDGTYSYSQNHSGTCSHHKGVKVWL